MIYEIKKIFSQKVIIIWVILLCAASLIYPAYFTYRYNKDSKQKFGNVDKAYEEVWEEYRGYGFDDVSAKSHEEYANRESDFCARPVSKYHLYLSKARERKTGIHRGVIFEFNMQLHSIEGIEQQLWGISDKNSYRYRNLSREKAMMESCKVEYSNTLFWENYDVFETILAMVIFIFVLFSLAGIYPVERSSNMRIILSASPVSDFKIITNKWMAGALIGVGSLILVNVNLAAVFILGGSASGFDKCVVNLGMEFAYTPYNITILEYMIIKLIIQTIAMLFLVAFTEYVSLVAEYRYQVVLFGGLLFIPQLVSYIGVFGRENSVIADTLSDWSLLGGIYTNHLFYKYHALNLFGFPVDFYVVYLALLIGLTVLAGTATVKKYRRYVPEYSRRGA